MPIRVLLCVAGVVGILAVVGLQVFATLVAPVRSPSGGEQLLFSMNALPFVYYLLRGVRGTRGFLAAGAAVHLAWLPAVVGFLSDGSFELPLFMASVFVAFMVLNYSKY